MTIHESKSYKKLDSSYKKAINAGIKKLQKRYEYYRNQNIVITNLFGDDVIIHKIIEDNWYVYKCRMNKIQIRLLYEVDIDNDINVIDYYIKNKDKSIKGKNSCTQKQYLDNFKIQVMQRKKLLEVNSI